MLDKSLQLLREIDFQAALQIQLFRIGIVSNILEECFSGHGVHTS